MGFKLTYSVPYLQQQYHGCKGADRHQEETRPQHHIQGFLRAEGGARR